MVNCAFGFIGILDPIAESCKLLIWLIPAAALLISYIKLPIFDLFASLEDDTLSFLSDSNPLFSIANAASTSLTTERFSTGRISKLVSDLRP